MLHPDGGEGRLPGRVAWGVFGAGSGRGERDLGVYLNKGGLPNHFDPSNPGRDAALFGK